MDRIQRNETTFCDEENDWMILTEKMAWGRVNLHESKGLQAIA